MTLQINDCEQGTPAWFECRLGIPTASEFHTVLASGRDGGKSITRTTYMRKLAGERITGKPATSYANAYMDRGKTMEDEARERYAFERGVIPRKVGFIRNGDMGASPDSLIDDDGGLEIKTAEAHIQIERLLRDDLPPEHRAQVQGSIMVAERGFWDFMSFWPGMPPLIVRVLPDHQYIANLRGEIARFNDELAALVERVRAYGRAA